MKDTKRRPVKHVIVRGGTAAAAAAIAAAFENTDQVTMIQIIPNVTFESFK